jgi:hypothetical protein
MVPRWTEWVIGVCVTVLAIGAIWSVFGDEIALLVSR